MYKSIYEITGNMIALLMDTWASWGICWASMWSARYAVRCRSVLASDSWICLKVLSFSWAHWTLFSSSFCLSAAYGNKETHHTFRKRKSSICKSKQKFMILNYTWRAWMCAHKTRMKQPRDSFLIIISGIFLKQVILSLVHFPVNASRSQAVN